MSFKFNFDGNADSDSENSPAVAATANNATASTQPTLPAQFHTLASLIPTLPRNISYTPLRLSKSLILPRRELYDVRMQLMASDPLTSPPAAASNAAIGLGDEDIRTKVYEGGLKSWECSVDLAEYLHSQSHPSAASTTTTTTTLELGCGTALPSLALFRELLLSGEGMKRMKKRMVLADYNEDVLQLVTLPNLLLTWAAIARKGGGGGVAEDELPGDLDASDELKAEFAGDLERRGIELAFVSGGWGNGMLEILNGFAGEQGFDLVLASETIYSPETTPEFAGVLLGSLKKPSARGLVAAKRIYFGVGGSVEDFVGLVGKRDAGQWSTRIARDTAGVGVERVIVEVARKE